MNWEEERLQYERQLDRSVEKIIAAAPRCEIHGNPFIAGVGIGDKFYPAKPGGECPVCLRERYGL